MIVQVQVRCVKCLGRTRASSGWRKNLGCSATCPRLILVEVLMHVGIYDCMYSENVWSTTEIIDCCQLLHPSTHLMTDIRRKECRPSGSLVSSSSLQVILCRPGERFSPRVVKRPMFLLLGCFFMYAQVGVLPISINLLSVLLVIVHPAKDLAESVGHRSERVHLDNANNDIQFE